MKKGLIIISPINQFGEYHEIQTFLTYLFKEQKTCLKLAILRYIQTYTSPAFHNLKQYKRIYGLKEGRLDYMLNQ